MPIAEKPERILLQEKSLECYNHALRELIALSHRFEDFDDLYFAEHAIGFYHKQDNRTVPYKKYTLTDFIMEAEQHESLKDDIHTLMQNLAKSDLMTEDGWVFRSTIHAYAMLKKDYIRFYVEYLRAADLEGESEEYDDIEAIIKHYGWCDETLNLIIGRLIDFTGQFGIVQFAEHTASDLGVWLKDNRNADYFSSLFRDLLILLSYNEKHAIDRAEEGAKALFGENSPEGKQWLTDTLEYYHSHFSTLEALSDECNDILTEKKGYDFADALFEKIKDTGNKELYTKFSGICYNRSNTALRTLCGEEFKPLNQTNDVIFSNAETWMKICLKYSYSDDKYNFPYIEREKKIRQMLILYQNWGRACIHAAEASTVAAEKEPLLHRALELFERGFVYNPHDVYTLMNYTYALHVLFMENSPDVMKKRYRRELSLIYGPLEVVKNNPDYLYVLGNSATLFAGLKETEKSLDFLECVLKANQKEKKLIANDFSDPEFDYLRDDPRFKKLMEKYF